MSDETLPTRWLVLFLPVVWFSFFKELFPFLGGYADARFLLSFILPVATVLFVLKTSEVRLLPLVGWLLFAASGVISLLIDPFATSFSWVEAVFFPAYLAAVAGVAWVYRDCSSAGLLVPVYGLLGGMTLYALMTPAEYLFVLSGDVSRVDTFLPWGFVNIRYWSHLSTWLLPLLPLAVLIGPFRNNRLWRVGVLVTAGVWWWLVLLSSARGSFVSILISGAILLLLFGKHVKPWLVVLLGQFSVGVVCWAVLSVLIPWMLMTDVELRGVGADTSGRVRLWWEAWAMSLVNFPFGMGPQSWLTHDVITPAYESGKRLGHPHNMYLMWAAEYGWLGVSGLAMIGAEGVRRIWRVRRQMISFGLPFEQVHLVIAFTASVVSAFVHAGASAVFLAPSSMLVGFAILPVFWGVMTRTKFNSEANGLSNVSRFKRGRFLSASIVLTALVFWNVEVVRYYQAMRGDQKWYTENVKQPFYPRYWYHGYYPRHPDMMPVNNQ